MIERIKEQPPPASPKNKEHVFRGGDLMKCPSCQWTIFGPCMWPAIKPFRWQH